MVDLTETNKERKAWNLLTEPGERTRAASPEAEPSNYPMDRCSFHIWPAEPGGGSALLFASHLFLLHLV